MKERPILFSGAMVKALLAGTKTQTRRIVKPQPNVVHAIHADASITTNCIFRSGDGRIHCPYGQSGDRLWVKETWRVNKTYNALSPTLVGVAMGGDTAHCIDYIATLGRDEFWGKTRVSIHMPRWASRITLEITAVRVERLNDITEEDARAEGVEGVFYHAGEGKVVPHTSGAYRKAYSRLWDEIHGPLSFQENPWVWVLTFTKL